MLSPKTKRNINRVLPFGIIWMLCGWVFLAIEHAAIDHIGTLPTTAIRLDWQVFLFANTAVFLLGLIVGLVEVVLLEPLFISKKFWQKILYKLMIYSVILFLVILITFPIAASMELDISVFNQRVWDKYFHYLGSITFLSTALQLSISLVLSLFYSEISETVGHRSLLNFFTGRYHTPSQEERIFMFLDMKGSTTIAEKLGHVTYFKLLKSYYSDLSSAIINHAGEIYQYAGDEVIVSWKLKEGLTHVNCLKCFFAMKRDLKAKEQHYKEKFGLMPSFKAGFHCGKVTTGEIGVLKREIFFTGDVLNAAARIQSLCNQYKVDLLVSDVLLAKLSDKHPFQIQNIGEVYLRGKEERLALSTLTEKGVSKSILHAE